MMTPQITSIILAGGQGRRLHPLTKARSKPAVPIGGKFRLIDIPISNCLHHGIRQIWVLTQFASESLHRHIFQTYRMDNFSKGFVSVLAASQTLDSKGWYQGTADAVRKNLTNFRQSGENILLLSGDHLYRMDFHNFLKFHQEHEADISLSVVPVERSKVSELGIMKMDANYKVLDFVEKPKDDSVIDNFELPLQLRPPKDNGSDEERSHVGSMGIYLFKKQVLIDLLDKYDFDDFGKQIIPAAISNYNVAAYPFSGYWEDIGTIKAFFDSHISLTTPNSPFNFYDQEKPIFTHARFLPAAKISGSSIDSSIVCEGSMIENATIADSVIGVRSVIRKGCNLSRVIFMGADYYDEHGTMGIGKNCRIENAILDKDVHIGDDVNLTNVENIQNGERDGIIIRDGIIAVPKGMHVPSGYTL
ncbi:glucose-1-phosphate adenylyltransferase [Chitinispirillales bacterium ANBcel5]|uniref:glucose-1-phosphate adenylyltransferase n=1 Tax=Cellulosispirillum alkaliphilum TaxID=3039283 RepID=UPI002A539395|nr:glucose-1-phosphate adenylyltransferase [Chitinispirillales bacterium ANBcel5]